jgi:hypothetical protein
MLTVSVYSHQCARDALNEYYINLVRTNGSGRYALARDTSQSGDDSDVDLDSGLSRDPSPEISMSPIRHLSNETSPIQSEAVPRATLEQNMAFAALQQSQSQHKHHPPLYQQPN